MKIIILVMCSCHLLPVRPEELDRYTYCEMCLTAAQEIERAVDEAPAGSRRAVAERLLGGGACEKLLPGKHEHSSKDKVKSSCTHLFESHRDRFHAALVESRPKHVGIALCYEQSAACVGVKREAFGDSKTAFTESDIEALLQDNKEKVRVARPVRSGSVDEL